MFAFFMLQTRDWQVFTTKRQVVNPFGLWGRWSLSQLLPSALTAKKEPQTTWEGMNVAVFQQNLIFRKRWQAGFGLWMSFAHYSYRRLGGGGRSGLTQGQHPFVLRYLQALVPCFSVPGHLEKAMDPHVESTLARKFINQDCCFLHVKPFFQGHCYFDSFFPQSKRILLDRPWDLAAVVTEKLNA